MKQKKLHESQPNRKAPARWCAAFVAALLLTTGGAEAASLLIDHFDVSQSVEASTTPGSMSSVAEGIGGERDMRVFPAPFPGGFGTIDADANVTAPSVFTFRPMSTGPSGLAELEYDGVDGTPLVNPVGLGGLDLTGGGTEGAFVFDVLFTDTATAAVVTVHTDANNRSNFGITIPAGVNASTLFYANYADFVTVSGASGPADFTNVGAIEFVFLGPPPTNLTLQLDSIGTAVPEPTRVLMLGFGALALACTRRRRGIVKQAACQS